MKAILFDMDGVLVATSDFHVKAWIAFAREYGRELTEEEIKRRLGFNNREYMRFVLSRDPTELEVRDATERKEALYREIYAPFIQVPPGLLVLLQAFQRADIACAVATSAPSANVDFVLDGLGLRPYFKEVVDASQVTRGKPDPEIYLTAAAKLGAEPTSCLVFEDAIAGIQSGQGAGMKVIALTTSYPATVLQEHHPDAIIDAFTDLQNPGPALAVLRETVGQDFSVF